MQQLLRYILPVYGALYFLFLLLIRTLAVRRKIGKNPVVLSASDDAYGLVAGYFKLWMILLCIYIAFYAAMPAWYSLILPMSYLENNTVQMIGLAIMAVSLVWTYIAQAGMHESWRVGIDQSERTDLVTTGIFRFSRNPIYVGMIASILGLFMVTPNAFTALLLINGFILIQLQVRLEEDFLYKTHGKGYLDYKNSVRRFI